MSDKLNASLYKNSSIKDFGEEKHFKVNHKISWLKLFHFIKYTRNEMKKEFPTIVS